jgi:NADH-quinone oxidoreductase subunit C
MDLATVVDRVKKKFPEAVLEVSAFRGETTLQIRPGDLLPLCRFLREDPEMAFDFLIDLCGVDYLPREPRFQVVYHLCSTRTRLRLRLKVSLPGTDPKIASVFSVWKAADWMERRPLTCMGCVCGTPRPPAHSAHPGMAGISPAQRLSAPGLIITPDDGEGWRWATTIP